jgi:hypothetical protein
MYNKVTYNNYNNYNDYLCKTIIVKLIANGL